MIEEHFWCSSCACCLAFGLGHDCLGGAPRLSGVTGVVHTGSWRASALASEDEGRIFSSLFLLWFAHIYGLSPSDLYIPSGTPPWKGGIPLFVLCYAFEEDPPHLLRAASGAWQRGDTCCAFPSTPLGPFLGSCHHPEGKGTVCSASAGAGLPAARAGSRR